MNKPHKLFKLFYPDSVAVIGASNDLFSINGRCLMFMLQYKSKTRIYPVNPSHRFIQGLKCYQKVEDLPEIPDVAVIMVGKKWVFHTVESLSKVNCPFAIIITSGYAERDESGKKEQDELINMARECGIHVVGPNCLGIINTILPVVLSWSTALDRNTKDLPSGNVAMVSQSGAILGAILDGAIAEGLGFSYLVSSGNEADLGLVDFMDFFAGDEHTRVIMAFVETLKDPSRFMNVTEKLHYNNKSVVLYKVGKTDEGRSIAASHTGALTGSDETFDALCKKCGIIRVDRIDSLISVAKALSVLTPATGGRVGVFCCSGGAAGMFADHLRGSGLSLASTNREFDNDIGKITGFAPPYNPLDILKGPLQSPEIIALAMRRFVNEENFDLIIILMTPMFLQAISPKMMLEGLRYNPGKPVLCCWLGGEVVRQPIEEMQKGGVVTFNNVESCIDAASALVSVGHYRSRLKRFDREMMVEDIRGSAVGIIKKCNGIADEVTSKNILSLYGISIPRGFLTKSVYEARSAALKLGFPLVLKGVSCKLTHKTEVGAIRIGIENERELEEAYLQLLLIIEGYDCKGILVEEMLPKPIAETIVGVKFEEPCFHKVIFGLGGVFVEVFKDVTVRLAPLTEEDAEEMISEIKARKVLDGFRGNPPVDKQSIIKVLLSISRMVNDLADEIAEIDINPLMVYEKKAVAADALIVFR